MKKNTQDHVNFYFFTLSLLVPSSTLFTGNDRSEITYHDHGGGKSERKRKGARKGGKEEAWWRDRPRVFKFRAETRVFPCGAARSPTCATVATMAEALALDTYPVTISNIYITSSSSSLFSMRLVLNSRDAGVLGCSIARWLRRGRPVNVPRGPVEPSALSPVPLAACARLRAS